jgi:protein SCO1
MRKKILVLAMLVAAVLIGLLATGRLPVNRAPRSSVAADGNYELIGADGSLFARSRLKGRSYITYFGYASCPDRCPTMLVKLARLRKEMGIAPQDLPIVFITVDPKHDTPERLATFVKTLGIPIYALTGDEQVIYKVLDNAGIFVRVIEQPGGGYRIDHTTSAFLYDAAGDFSEAIVPDDSDAAVKAKLSNAMSAPASPSDVASSSAPAPSTAQAGKATASSSAK